MTYFSSEIIRTLHKTVQYVTTEMSRMIVTFHTN